MGLLDTYEKFKKGYNKIQDYRLQQKQESLERQKAFTKIESEKRSLAINKLRNQVVEARLRQQKSALQSQRINQMLGGQTGGGGLGSVMGMKSKQGKRKKGLYEGLI